MSGERSPQEDSMITSFRDFDDTLRTLDLLQRRFDRAFDGLPGYRWPVFAGPLPRGPELRLRRRAQPAWPPLNVFETKDAFEVRADVPGLAEGAVSVSVEEGTLVIRGERKTEIPDGYKVHLRERAPIAFTRNVSLPGRIDASGVTATLKDGVLTVTLPKAKEALPRQIAVKAV
jgi:HSP20 family protein